MKIHVVLVRTEYSGNLGAATRAMANMGADRLILIDPRCAVNTQAKEMAAGAQDRLTRATVYPTWDEFYQSEDEGLRLALTRRGGRNRKVFALEEKLTEVAATSLPETLYLIFGPEADGLDKDDLGFVNFAVHLPVYGEFASLNLSQAVLLALFVTRQTFKPEILPAQVKGLQVPAARPFYFPDQLLKNWLTAMGFDIQARKASAYLTLKKLFLQNLPTQHEIQVLESILQQNVRKLKAANAAEQELIGLTTKNRADDLGDITRKDI